VNTEHYDDACAAQVHRLREMAREAKERDDLETWIRAEELLIRALENIQRVGRT